MCVHTRIGVSVRRKEKLEDIQNKMAHVFRILYNKESTLLRHYVPLEEIQMFIQYDFFELTQMKIALLHFGTRYHKSKKKR